MRGGRDAEPRQQRPKCPSGEVCWGKSQHHHGQVGRVALPGDIQAEAGQSPGGCGKGRSGVTFDWTG